MGGLLPSWWKLGAAGLLLAGAFGAGWMVNGWRLGERIQRMEHDQAQAELSAALAAGVKEAEWTKNLEDARNAATQREITIRADAAAARGAADGLRDDLAEIRRQLPSLAAEACHIRADALADVFQQCAGRYSELAEKADRHASDARTLSDAWPE